MIKFIKEYNVPLTISMFLLLFSICIVSLYRYQKEYQSYLGRKVVIGKDTLIITDCNTGEASFTLSNRVKLSKFLIEKDPSILIKEK